jgi:hypothetical protein
VRNNYLSRLWDKKLIFAVSQQWDIRNKY